jgi:asparagine synthase (glutamine-hydrolysing)
MAIVPELPLIYDEPFADSSQIPTVLVSRLARASVTVALSGDGGDELFGGYERYRMLERHARTRRPVAVAGRLAYTLLGRPRHAASADALGRGPEPIVRRLLSEGVFAEQLAPGADHAAIARRFEERWAATAGLGGLTSRAMALDTTGYLPDDILHKVDRAGMSVGLETRVPLLDHRVVSLAWRLPASMRVRDGVGKQVLRQVLARHVPLGLVERPKAGFAVPLGAWLRGPLRGWADGLLSPDALRDDALIDIDAAGRLWRAHLSRRWDASRDLWPLLMFQAWRQT